MTTYEGRDDRPERPVTDRWRGGIGGTRGEQKEHKDQNTQKAGERRTPQAPTGSRTTGHQGPGTRTSAYQDQRHHDGNRDDDADRDRRDRQHHEQTDP